MFSGFSELGLSYSDKVGSIVSGKLIVFVIVFAEVADSILCG